MSNQPLFMPYRMGDLNLPNRIVMAPLTRMRAIARSMASRSVCDAPSRPGGLSKSVAAVSVHSFHTLFCPFIPIGALSL